MDKDIVLNYLYRNNIETSFLTENVLAFGLNNDKTKKRCGCYYGYFEGSQLKGILPFYNHGGCIPHYESTNAIKEFAQIMASGKLDTLMGVQYIIEPLFMLMNEIKKLEFYAQTSYYINTNFKPFILDGIEFAKGSELPLKMTSKFIKASLEDSFSTIKKPNLLTQLFTEDSIDEDFIFLLKNGEIKAQANIHTRTDKINQIGAVYTLNSERRQGYGKAIVSEVCKRIITLGKIPTLLVRNNNTAAIRTYKSLGFTLYDNYLFANFSSI
jgi:hypothetical protein